MDDVSKKIGQTRVELKESKFSLKDHGGNALNPSTWKAQIDRTSLKPLFTT